VDEDSDDEGRTACENLAGLLQYLDGLQSRRARITEVTHVVNNWIIDGVVLPMKHHGVVFKVGASSFLRTHLVQEGLAWKVYDAFPTLPETTCYVKTYHVNKSVAALRQYCTETEEWSWPSNDCEYWAHGAILNAGVEDPLYESAVGTMRRLWNPPKSFDEFEAAEDFLVSRSEDNRPPTLLGNLMGFCQQAPSVHKVNI
jgi:hypothetical protein